MQGFPRFTLFVALATLAACGGGGGGGGIPGDVLAGTLTIPALSAGGMHREGRPNDDGHHAEDAGRLEIGNVLRLVGRVDPKTDPLDVFRIRLPEAMHVTLQFETEHAAACHAFEVDSGREVLRAKSGGPARTGDVDVRTLDIAIAADLGAATGYVVTLRATARDGSPLVAPVPATREARPSTAQARYVGAHHEMVAGEIVVTRATDAPEAALALPGCERKSGGQGPLELYRIVGPELARPTTAGAPLAASLELQTALLARRIEKLPGVRAASPNLIYRSFTTEPNDTLYPRQWHYRQIKLPLAWDETTGSTSVIIGVVDTGIVLGHADFSGRLIAGIDTISDAARALDGDGRDTNPDDPGSGGGAVPSSFHGTHVGGTIGARTNNSSGCAGVDWNCKIMPIRVLGKGGSGTLLDIADGILYGARLANSTGQLPPQRCNALNMSLGGPGSTSVLQKACDDAQAAGVILIAASGNDNASTLNYPASYTSVVSVGSTDFARARAPYSNFATTIDIWAPGGNQRVDLDNDTFPDGVLSLMASGFAGSRSATFNYLQGTSMACPHVAGVCALMLAVRPTMTQSEFKSFITANSQAGNNLPNTGKLIDAHAAVLAAKGASPSNPVLAVTPSQVNFAGSETQKTVTMANRGTGTLTYEAAKSGFIYKSGDNWLTPTILIGGTGISHSGLRLEVSRAGLANGDYEAEITLTFSSGGTDYTQKVAVTMQVGTQAPKSEEIFILLVDIDTLDTANQVVSTAAQSYAYSMPGVALGEYLLVAGTDRNNDGFVGDIGELFGVWPDWDFPLILSAPGTGVVRNSMNFDLGEVLSLSVPGKEPGKFPRKFRLLR